MKKSLVFSFVVIACVLGLHGEKPKRMHRRTFERLMRQLEEADAASWAYGLARFGPDALNDVLGINDVDKAALPGGKNG